MPSCAAPHCTSKQFKGCGLTFHLFPKSDIERQRQWLANIGRGDGWIPMLKSTVCSKHFTSDCFDRTGQTVRLRDGCVPTILGNTSKNIRRRRSGTPVEESYELSHKTHVTAKVKTRETEKMASRPKRVIKAKRRDDEIYTTSTNEPVCKRRAVAQGRRKESNGQHNDEALNQKPTRKKVSDAELTDKNSAIYIKIQESVKVEKDGGGHLEPAKDNLPKKRIPKPSLKLRIKEEQFSDEESLFDSDLSETDYVPVVKKSPKKSKHEIKKVCDSSSDKVSKNSSLSSLKNENGDSTESRLKEENVEEVMVTIDKTVSVGKDKIIQLSNNRTYFEFAEPKKKVILQIKPSTEAHELKSQTLEELVNSLKLRGLICSNVQELLESFKELPDGIVRVNAKLLKKLPKVFSEEIQKFTTVLYLYSPKAYDLVTNLFCLPDKNLLRERIRAKRFLPGFTNEALEMLKNEKTKEPAKTVCSIMLDFLSVRKECRWNTVDEVWMGHVDFCGGPCPYDSDEIPLASEILLLTAVGIGHDWKLPFGYFLNNGLSGEALQSIVNEAIIVLEECGLKVRVIVCDGSQSTVKMGVLFGCNIYTKSFTELVTCFPHPIHEKQQIHLVFGIQHALSLLRNFLAERGILRSSTYGIIKWKYFERLRGIEKEETREIRKTFDADHMKFYHLQRILRLCHPSFSCAENRALELADSLKMNEYGGSEASTNFVADIYRAFDLLNSRNPVTTGEKPPITSPFLAEQLESMAVIGQRIFGIEFLSGKRVIGDGRWMSVMLFAFTLKSVSVLASTLLNEEPLLYIATYRFNLDHSDMMLSCIQRHGGWDDTPTATEFREGYKALFEPVTDSTKLSIFSCDFDGCDLTVGQGLICPVRRRLHLRGYADIEFMLQSCPLTDWGLDIEARGRCIIRHMSQRLSCAECMTLMLDNNYSTEFENRKFALDCIRPSTFILNILKVSETVFRMKFLESRQIEVEYVVIHIFTEYLTNFGETHYGYSNHVLEEPHHIISLIKVVIRTFVECKLYATKHMSLLKSRLLEGS